MLKNYLVTALRTLGRHRGYTALTVAGLALGMTVCLLILTFVWEQKSYDRFHTKADRIVRILSEPLDDGTGEVSMTLAASPAPLAEAIEREVPGIEASVRLGQIRSRVLRGNNTVDLTGLYAEPTFFDLFDFAAASGDPRAVLAQPYHVLLTQDATTKLFGNADPIGATITLDGHGDFIVGGLLNEPPGPSHLKFDVLASYATLAASAQSEELADWRNTWRFATYLLLDDAATAERLEATLPRIAERVYADQDGRIAFRTQPLRAIALGPVVGNEISSYSIPALLVYFLAALGLIVMMTAGFNYVSLSTARAVRRAPEVGARKALGAKRSPVMVQFLSEAVLMALGALVVAYGLLLWLVPAFNRLTFIQMADTQLDASHLLDPRLIGVFVLFTIAVGLVAGLYPAIRLARFAPITALQGQAVRGFSGRWLRHGLIGAQFGLALFFVVTTALLVAQARHLLHADYGFSQDDLISVRLQGQDYEVFRSELLRYPEVTQVAATSTLPASGSTSGVALRRVEDDEPIRAFEYAVDAHFLDAFDLDLLAGRTFSDAREPDSAHVMVNETALRILGLGTPTEAVGTLLLLDEPERTVEVVGVVRDYHYNVLIEPIEALVLYEAPAAYQYGLIRTQSGAREAAAARLDAVWATLTQEHPIDYAFLDEVLAEGPANTLFGSFTRVIAVIAGLAVLISMLGLFGMAAYHVETRIKEAGVRKVLGARRRDIVLLLSRTFIGIVLVGALVAVPLAWLAGRGWLQVFAVRIEPSPWLLAGCALGMAALALGVVVSQTLRAASADPVKALRYE